MSSSHPNVIIAKPVQDGRHRYLAPLLQKDTRRPVRVVWYHARIDDVRADGLAVALPPDGNEVRYMQDLDAFALASTDRNLKHWFPKAGIDGEALRASFVPSVDAHHGWRALRTSLLRPPTLLWNGEPLPDLATLQRRYGAEHPYRIHVVARCDGVVFEAHAFYLKWSLESVKVWACSHDRALTQEGALDLEEDAEVDVDRPQVEEWCEARIAQWDARRASEAEAWRQKAAQTEARREEMKRRWEALKTLSTGDPAWARGLENLQDECLNERTLE